MLTGEFLTVAEYEFILAHTKEVKRYLRWHLLGAPNLSAWGITIERHHHYAEIGFKRSGGEQRFAVLSLNGDPQGVVSYARPKYSGLMSVYETVMKQDGNGIMHPPTLMKDLVTTLGRERKLRLLLDE